MYKKRIVVTGGAGFIGSHLCAQLLNAGHKVLCVDNFFTGKKENLSPLLDHPLFEVIRHNICDPFTLEADEIYNLACPASPVHYQMFPVETVRANVMGAINVLELARRFRSKVFQASTSEVYGDPLEHPQRESYWGHVNPIGERSCYDEGKRCAETLFFDYHRQYKIPIRIGRIFNTYGPNMDENDGRVVSNFILQALRGEPITIYGEGLQTRSFCFVDDLVSAIVRFMQDDVTFMGPLNLGNPKEMTIIAIAKMIIDLTGSRSSLVYKTLPSDDPRQRQPDISQARMLLQWEPQTTLKDGLMTTIEYFESRLKANRAPRRMSLASL